MTIALTAAEAVDLAKGLAWPVLVGIVLWRLFPTARRVLESRGFTVRIGGAEITVQQASEQIAAQLDDLRAQLSAVKAGGDSTPIASGVPRLSRVLWVDDHPENNAFEIAALARQNVEVITAHTTAEGLRRAGTGSWDVVVSDLGREEAGRFVPDAGLELAEQLHERSPDLPVVIYTSAPTLARVREHPVMAQLAGATASGTELLDVLGRLGCGRVA